ncbi:2-dehydropantoate 2-reductase [Delitschia confertaspora ATCC 74209]|uniref:2-dehydropantoate 2-reductase n=1 Tax=Delitschia confertaspora ATCC 74209 TaxID=1513339 RepID=A0A9P4JQK4_9PLEO|nr:2-dehydropantoate 2-reductase [Delitschia confertaspora ATCC 74209]
MSEHSKPKVLLFGAGSVGAIYLYLLSKVSSVTAVCRSNYDTIKQDGFIINSHIFGQNIHFKPNVVRDCTEAASSTALPGKPFDFVVVCSKAIPATVPKLIAPAITPDHTAIVLIQNGIGIEQEYADAFPTNPIISSVVYLPVTQRPAGIITHGEIERLELGAYPSTALPTHAKVFTELVKAAGGTAEFQGNVQLKRWTKLLVNASWNPICALTRCTDIEFMSSSLSSTDFVFAIMMEIVEVARAYGAMLSRDDAEFQLGRAKARIPKSAGVEPSMLQDVRAGRKMEVEAIVGNVVRMAEGKGVKVPKLAALYVLAKGLDASL